MIITPRRPLHRRAFLRGILRGAAVAVGLPPLEAMFNASGTAYACDGVLPRRFGLFFWGNGNLPDYWTPIGEGEGWRPSEQLAPLQHLTDVVSVVSGMAVKFDNVYPHGSGLTGFLSGFDMTTDETFAAPSIDQLIAGYIGGDTIYRSLQTGATMNSGVSYNGPHSQNPPETSPWAFFDRIFGETFREPGEGGEPDPTLALRQSVLDAVMDDVAALDRRISAADRARLDQHLTGIRELEQRLARLQEDPPELEACERAAEPLADYPDVDGRPQISAVSRAMCDLLAMALACDQTRVFGHYLSDPVSDVLFEGTSAGHHDLTHNEGGEQPEVNQITIQCVEEYAYLVDALRAIPEGDGTLLDNCAVLGTSEVSAGQLHSIDEMPILIAGSACGFLKSGFHYRSYTQENASHVMMSLMRAMDITVGEFGDGAGLVTDGLSAIEV